MPNTKAWLPWLLLVVGLLVGAAAGGAGVYFLTRPAAVAPAANQSNSAASNSTTTENNATSNVANTISTTTQVPDDWKVYHDKTYDVSFSYPPAWGAIAVDKHVASEDSLPIWPVDQTEVSFGFNTDPQAIQREFKSVELTALSAYSAADKKFNGGSQLIKDADALLEVYHSRSAASLDHPLWMPSSNAAIIAATTPQYIENADGSFRGIYYYAFIGQNDPTTGSAKKMTAIRAVLTDGINVVQVSYDKLPNDYIKGEGTYTTYAGGCFTGIRNVGPYTCLVSDKFTSSFEDTISLIVDSIT